MIPVRGANGIQRADLRREALTTPTKEVLLAGGDNGVVERDRARDVVYLGDNLPFLRNLPSGSVDLIYTDPPFNTGRVQSRTRLRTVQDDVGGDRTGFQGRRYRTELGATRAFADAFDDYLSFLEPRLHEAHRVLAPTGSLYLHLDCREVHYAKVMLDSIFGRDCFLNEIIWAYDYGGRLVRLHGSRPNRRDGEARSVNSWLRSGVVTVASVSRASAMRRPT